VTEELNPPQPQATAAEDLPDPVMQAFEEVCGRLSGFEYQLDAEASDGYLTAVAASWRRIPLDEVLPKMCGDAFERVFADPQDEAQARAALQGRLDQILEDLSPDALLDEPDTLRLAPLMGLWDDEARRKVVEEGHADEAQAQRLQTGALWAEGFMRALDDFAADWPEPSRRDKRAAWCVEAVESIAILMVDPASEAFRLHVGKHWKGDPPTRDELIDATLMAVQDLRVWWLDHPPPQAPRRVEREPGRNDPCPCGSGRKFKKCHGAA
jgi:uncharacterized protein